MGKGKIANFLRFFAILLFLTILLAACSDKTENKSALNKDKFTLRQFHPFSGGNWIGNAICYGPHRDGQQPGGPFPTAAEIRQDIDQMLPHWNMLRIYGSSGFAETMLDVIQENNLKMKVMLGVWIAPNAEAANQREIETAIRLTKEFPEIIIAVSVGNETQVSWSAHRSPIESLIKNVHQIRTGVKVPVTVADDFNFWNKPESKILSGELDFITMHAHPMWNGLQVDRSLEWLKEQTEIVQKTHPEHLVVIGETGWATSVHDQGEQAKLIKGQPGEAEQKQFYNEVRNWAESEKITVFFFEAYDENWKGGPHPAEVEKHWGLFKVDRTTKESTSN